MQTHDKALARIIGALFVVTMLMGMVDAYLAGPVLRGPLEKIHEHASTVMLGGAMRLLMSIGVIGIAAAFHPVVRRYDETMAVTYLVCRCAECVLLCLGVCAHVFLLDLSQSLVDAPGADVPVFLALGRGALGFTRTTYQMAMTLLGAVAAAQAWVLLRTRLLPAWLAGLGVVGYLLVLASAILDLVGVVDTMDGTGALLYVPGGLFELVLLPAWLWLRGFDAEAADRARSARGVVVA